MRNLLISLNIFVICVMTNSCKKDSLEPLQNQQSDIASSSASEHMMGALTLPPAEYNKLPKANAGNYIESLPSSYSINCPAILNQGTEASCVAWATAYAARSIMEAKRAGATSYSNSSNIFSPEYVYNQIKVSADCGSGSYIVYGLNLLTYSTNNTHSGVCTWSYMPSVDGCSTMPDASAYNDAATHCISSWGTVSKDVATIKNEVATGVPVIIGIRVDQAFENLGGKVYSSYNDSKFIGNHALCIVGYDDSKNAFKVMNSWGTRWGASGYGWISYSLVNTIMFNELYVITGLN